MNVVKKTNLFNSLEKRTFVCYNDIGDIMKVEEIKKLKSGKYKVKIGDETITTYDDVILNHHLLYQKDISCEDFEKIELDNNHANIYHKALTYALRKVRSVYELKKFLDKFEIEEEMKSEILNRLQQIGLLSDEAYVKAYISDCLYLSNDGPNKIRNYLLAQEIDEGLVMSRLDEIDQSYVYEKLKKLVQKKLNKDHKHSNYQLQQKIIFDMVNLGYDRDMIVELLSTMTFSDDEKLRKEYDKQYHKLQLKYSGSELYHKIQEKLYSKGFDIHDIQNYIEKQMKENEM